MGCLQICLLAVPHSTLLNVVLLVDVAAVHPPPHADWRSLMVSSVRVLASGRHLCLICDKTNKQRGSMQRHMREVHAKCEEYLCPYCHSRFSSRSVFYSHFMRVHKTDVPDKISNFRVK